MKFEDFQKKVIDVTNTVGKKKTNDLIEEGKLLYKIRETEREIDRLYQDLGRAVYEADEDMEVSFEEYTSDKNGADRQPEGKTCRTARRAGGSQKARASAAPAGRSIPTAAVTAASAARSSERGDPPCFRRRRPRLRSRHGITGAAAQEANNRRRGLPITSADIPPAAGFSSRGSAEPAQTRFRRR